MQKSTKSYKAASVTGYDIPTSFTDLEGNQLQLCCSEDAIDDGTIRKWDQADTVSLFVSEVKSYIFITLIEVYLSYM